MKTRSGYVQGYNGQAMVNEGQMILVAELTREENASSSCIRSSRRRRRTSTH